MMKKVWNAKTDVEHYFDNDLSDLQCLLYCYADENQLLSSFFDTVHIKKNLDSYVTTHALKVWESKKTLSIGDFIINKSGE